jgi:hypothetical protein
MTEPSHRLHVVFYYTPIIIWIASIRSVECALVLATSHDADTVANTTLLLQICSRPLMIAMLIGFAITAALACLGKVRSRLGLILCLWPQQTLQTMAAVGVLYSIWQGVYPDGTVRPAMYIFQDQMPFVWFAVGHAVAVWQLMRLARSG